MVVWLSKPSLQGDPRGRDRSHQNQSIQQRAKGADFANCASGLRVSLLLWEKFGFRWLQTVGLPLVRVGEWVT